MQACDSPLLGFFCLYTPCQPEGVYILLQPDRSFSSSLKHLKCLINHTCKQKLFTLFCFCHKFGVFVFLT